jgi:hypothetical protein
MKEVGKVEGKSPPAPGRGPFHVTAHERDKGLMQIQRQHWLEWNPERPS